MTELFLPENDLEKLLIQAQKSEMKFSDFVEVFLKTDVFIPSGTEVLKDGSGMTPLIFSENDKNIIGIFTSLSRASLFKDKTPFCLSMKGIELFQRIPDGFGVVVNPGYDKGFDLPAEGIKNIIRDYVT